MPPRTLMGIGGIVTVGWFVVLVSGVEALALDEFGLQFFGGHSAPWRKPDQRWAGWTLPGVLR